MHRNIGAINHRITTAPTGGTTTHDEAVRRLFLARFLASTFDMSTKTFFRVRLLPDDDPARKTSSSTTDNNGTCKDEYRPEYGPGAEPILVPRATGRHPGANHSLQGG